MRRRKTAFRNKAASAALALISLSGFSLQGAVASSQPTIPESEASRIDALLGEISTSYRGQLADAPVLMKEFLALYPSSSRADEVRLHLANWYFYTGDYATALSCYNQIPANAFSGDIREGMLYNKAYCQVKTGYYDDAGAIFRTLVYSPAYGDDAQFYVAYLDYVAGNYDEAYEKFKKIKAKGPKGSEAEYYLNQIDYRRGDYRKVASTSDRLLKGDIAPELLPETVRVGALSYFKLGDKASAKDMLRRYVDMTGDGAEISALYALATIYYDEGNYSEALPLFSIVTDYPGDLAQSSWLYIGQIQLAQGNPQAAAMAFDKAARESWNGDVAETASYNLAVTSASGMALPFSDSAKAMEEFIRAYPDSPYSESLSKYLANAYYGRRDYEGALRQIEKVSHPDAETKAVRQKILYQLGVAQLRRGEAQKAVRSLGEASAAGQPDREVAAQAALWLGDAFYSLKDYSAAARAYRQATESDLLGNNKALGYYNLGYAYLKLKDYKKAEAAFRRATQLAGLNDAQATDARLRLGDCLYYNGKYDEALAIFRYVKPGGGQDGVFAAIREADILGRKGNVADKIAILEALMQRDDAGPWRQTVISRLADAYSEKGDDRKAAEYYALLLDAKSAGSSDAVSSQAYYSLATNAENLLKQGDREAALSAYRRLEASGIPALYPVAVTGIMRSSSDPEEIMAYATKVASMPGFTPEEADEATVTISRLKIEQGNLAEAEQMLLELIDNGSDDNYQLALAYIALSDIYALQDKDYLARLYLETLRSNYPGDEKEISNMIESRLKKLSK